MGNTQERRMNVQIFDDLIPEHLQNYFELAILGKTSQDDVVQYPTVDLRCRYESTAEENGHVPLSFVHVLKSSAHLSPHLENFAIVPSIVCEHTNLIMREIIQARIYVLVPHPTKYDHYKPHTDFPFDHTVVLYYVNDSDGATVLYNNDGSIYKKVEPKRGRVLVFDGNILHSGGIPRQGPRSVVNYDIITRKSL